MQNKISPVLVNNRNIYPFSDKAQFLSQIEEYKGILIAIGAEKLLVDNKELISIINNNIAYCDGFGAVYALKRKGVIAAKIPGAYFWLDVVKKFYKTKTFYVLGAKEDILNKTLEKLKTEFPNINIVGSQDGYYSNEDAVCEDIIAKNPDIIFAALGSPKQEYLMAKLLKNHPALYMGLGGSFDLYTGKAKPVPEWWNKIFKWEGLYRLFDDITNIKRIKRQKIIFKYFSYIINGKL